MGARGNNECEYAFRHAAMSASLASNGERNRTGDSMNLHQKIVPFLILCILQAGDLFSTRMVLSIPGSLELNPLVREFGLWPAKLLVLGLILLFAWRTKKLARLWAVCGIYALIVGSNMLVCATHARVLAQRVSG